MTAVQARRGTGRAPDFDVDSAIRDMPDKYVQCRDFNHSWRPYTAEWNGKERCYDVELKCSRCSTRRRRRIGRDGSLLGNQYVYAEGYLIKGMGRITGGERDVLRLESVLRIMPDGK